MLKYSQQQQFGLYRKSGKAHISRIHSCGQVFLMLSCVLVPAAHAADTAKQKTSAPATQAAGSTTQTTTDAKQTTPTSTACAGCYATIGLGTNINSKGLTDYTAPANVLQATHLGNATPQILVGVSYQVPWRGLFYSLIGTRDKTGGSTSKLNACDLSLYNRSDVDGAQIYCYPWRPFVSAKFTTDASQTFNGYTFGISHRIAKSLDLLLGYSFTAFNEASPGFQQAAIQTVRTQQGAKNPNYAGFSVTAMEHNWKNAFDGMPTQLISSTGERGALIYPGNPVSVHYHSGAFIGVVIPVSLKSLLGSQ